MKGRKNLNTMLSERHELNKIALSELKKDVEKTRQFSSYFSKMADLLLFLNEIYDTKEKSLEQLKQWNKIWYEEVSPEKYVDSLGNPAFCVQEYGKDYGQIFSFLYTEMRSGFIYAIEGRLFDLVINNELFLEISNLFLAGEEHPQQIKNIIFDHMRDYSEDVYEYRVREQLDPELNFATKIVMESDLSNPDILYQYGEYISKNEIDMLKFLNKLPREEITAMAKTYVDGFHEGFIVNNIDMSQKRSVNIRYTIGFEPVVREAVRLFAEIGLAPIIYRCGKSVLTRGLNKIGYISSSPNPQYEYDHRYDQAVFFDNRFMKHKLECYHNAYERYKEEAYVFAGPACMETFGETPFLPENKEENLKLTKKQQELSVEFQIKASEIMNQYIKPEQRSFTIIAYPIPEIGDRFEEIFREVVKVNTLDKDKYRKIQQHLIDTLDQAVEVHIKGKGENKTDLYVAMHEMGNPSKETNFENCLADVNIPVGEVFTSPKLTGTNGVLHVGEVYLNDLKFVDLEITFKDGMISEYTCKNFETEKENKAFIKENLLYNRDTLPMGEFAIGTNTTAYVMAAKYGIMEKLPILIAEKMGPHIAIGDTCYSYCEDVRVYNPDGKEIVAKENECSAFRKEDPKKAYFNCHTDITIPYEELSRIAAVTAQTVEVPIMNDVAEERVEIPILLDGRFVLEGTLKLNEPFEGK